MATKTKTPTKAEKKELAQLKSEGFDSTGIVGELEHAGQDVAGAPAGLADEISKGVKNEGNAVGGQAKNLYEAMTGPNTVLGGLMGNKAAPASAAKKSTKASTATNDQNLQEFANTLAQQYANAPLQAIGSEGAQLANENQAVTNAIAPFLTGSTSYNAGGSADPAVQAAMDAYSKAYATGEGVNSTAYTNMGIANEQYLASSPESAYLQLLSQPGSAYYKQIPSQLMKQLPESLQYALENIGSVNEGGLIGAAGAPKGGWPAAVKNEFGANATPSANTSVASSLLSGLGTVPGSPTSPTTLSGGNPATPGS